MGYFRLCVRLMLVLVFALPGCGDEEKTGQIRATPAYIKYFGEAPVPEEGICYARVGFLPASQDSSRLRPFPLFLFNEDRQLERLVERLLTLQEFDPGAQKQVLTFPVGTHLRSVRQVENEVAIDLELAGEPPAPEVSTAWAAALAETAGQFPDVKRVRVTHKGALLHGVPLQGLVPGDSRVSQPGPPEPLMISGSWHNGEDQPEEIQVLFDRPVTIEQLHLEDQHGRKIEGDYFQSMFDMAVVVHPQQPQNLSKGMPLNLRWKTVDPLGRRSEGSRVFFLLRIDR